ncbi:hypothetical protein XENTR_v10022110 [Xenopus tropicalis]|nr:hypothetical protein XENTR_v10022110 [Xenopus tropicalis]
MIRLVLFGQQASRSLQVCTAFKDKLYYVRWKYSQYLNMCNRTSNLLKHKTYHYSQRMDEKTRLEDTYR